MHTLDKENWNMDKENEWGNNEITYVIHEGAI